MKWYKQSSSVINDPNIAKISSKTFRFLIFLKAFCSEKNRNGKINESLDDLRFKFRCTKHALLKALDELKKEHLIKLTKSDEIIDLEILDWEETQYSESHKRVQKHRYIKGKCNGECNGQVTVEENRIEENRIDPPNPPGGSAVPEKKSVDDTETPILEFPCNGEKKTWMLTKEFVEKYRPLYPNLDILAECKQAYAWVISNSGNKKTAKGMPKFLNGWFQRSNDRGKGNRASPSSGLEIELDGYIDILKNTKWKPREHETWWMQIRSKLEERRVIDAMSKLKRWDEFNDTYVKISESNTFENHSDPFLEAGHD